MIYTDVMVDLETLGTTAGCSILSIGAIAFSFDVPQDDWKRFYSGPISRESCKAAGLFEEKDTIDWWQMQSQEARILFDEATTSRRILDDALISFSRFFPVEARLWGNGADFDNAILAAAYKSIKLRTPWRYQNNRCYRTIKAEYPGVEKPEFIGVKHNALDDAFNQALHLAKIRGKR